ncbi:uncharacterized protein CDV56_104468 [Aspergillus thermomutatus]|uniref:Amine oxidase domain-containing protein n=1 Tax=Aspergillus thermomutatus TaxID=41047 RepID=A0A397GCS1_ASPTH|nr:uncharacterized protein CDV56_104468 [Aspergillus thermomutatus]RHZ47909.1 hypothetical protein CDV56_104468 [Aspergillus thermomutatus]
MSPTQPKRVAIVGGGCAGITAFWALQKSPHDVHLFEASATLGGRIKTIPFENDGNKVAVNTVSSVFNATASHNLVSLLRYLGIPTSAAQFSFGATDGIGAEQWTGSILGDIVRRPWRLCKLETWHMLFDIARMRYTCLDQLVDGHQRSERHAQHETKMRHYFLKPLSMTKYLQTSQFTTNFDQSWPVSSFIVTSSDNHSKNRPEDPPDHIALKTCLTRVINDEQNIPAQLFGPVLITLDPFAPPHPLLVAGVWEFTDLEISAETLLALSLLPAIQNKRGLSFCLSWTSCGFLEDAVTSGLTVAVEHLGAKVPFALEHHPDLLNANELPQLHLSLADHLIRTLLGLLRVYVLIIEISLILLGALRGFLKNKMYLLRK